MRKSVQKIEEGMIFFRLTVVRKIEGPLQLHDRLYLCKCVCGNESKVSGSHLKSGHSRSCGCLKLDTIRTHGCSWRNGKSCPTGAYSSWMNMKHRCSNPETRMFKYYGGRGIKVCERWKDFTNFLADMGEPPTRKHSIDRINNDGDYEPSNCRWATRKEQASNKRSNILMTLNGKTQTLTEWAIEIGVKPNTVICRLRRGWTHEKSLLEPIGEWHRDCKG